MKKTSKINDLRAEYDFAAMSGGVRGKYTEAYRAGTNIAVLADDVASAFPTDDAVNRALRAIMDVAEAVPRGRKPSKRARKQTAAKRDHRLIPRQRRGGGR